MSVRTLKHSEGGIYFCTFTCWEWLPLIAETGLYDAIYRWMHLVHAQGLLLVGHVIMPNHVHLLMRAPPGVGINRTLSNAKRFLAYEVVKRLEAQGMHETLALLGAGLRAADRARGQKHRVFRTSSDIRECLDERMLLQKLRYIHANPVSGKWALAKDALDYPHSSFAFYEQGTRSPAPLIHYGLVIGGEI